MSRASFLDRSPEVSLASAFAIWIRWWLKRKLKRNSLSFSAAVPRLPLRSTSRRAIPVSSLTPAIVPHVRFQMSVPRGNRIHIEMRAAPRKATSTQVHFMQQLDPRASMKSEPLIVLALRRTRRFVRHWGKPRFTLIVVLPAERVAHTVPWPGERLTCQTRLNQRSVKHLSKSAVDWTTQWQHIDMAHSCSKALQSVSAPALIDDFFFESELANARPLNCSDAAGTGLIVETNSVQKGPCEIS
jgi:hypothetical protein